MFFSNIHFLCPDENKIKLGYVQIVDDKIAYVGEKRPNHIRGNIYDGTGKLLLPGFINTHCHVPMTLLRSLGADLPLEKWLNDKIFPIEKKLTDEYCYIGSILGIAELLRSGVTSFTDMYIFGEPRCKAVLETGIKANLCMGILCFDNSEFADAPYVKETKAIYQNYHNTNHQQLKIDVGIHAEYTSTPKVVEGAGLYAKEIGANVQLHLSETKKEVNDCLQRHKKTPVEYFNDLGVFENNTTAAHCVHITETDLDILSEKKVSVSHCPISNLKLGSGIADIVKMQNKGINVTIGTDGTASNDNLNFIEDMKLASMLQKGIHQNPSFMPSAEIIKMATQNGAIAQYRNNTGKIKEGYDADLIVIDFNSINLQPQLDALTSVIYAGLPSDVKLNMVKGKILYENGFYTTIDIEKILSEVRKISSKIY